MKNNERSDYIFLTEHINEKTMQNFITYSWQEHLNNRISRQAVYVLGDGFYVRFAR